MLFCLINKVITLALAENGKTALPSFSEN